MRTCDRSGDPADRDRIADTEVEWTDAEVGSADTEVGRYGDGVASWWREADRLLRCGRETVAQSAAMRS
jgi:hypothetical protein